MRVLKILLGAIVLGTLAVEGVNGGFLLMNAADDAAVMLGVAVVVASLAIPMTLARLAIRKGWA